MHHDDGSPMGGARRRPENEATPALTEREKLVVRLEHALRHHREHAAGYRALAEAAAGIGRAEAAELLYGVAEETARQAPALEKALAAVRRKEEP